MADVMNETFSEIETLVGPPGRQDNLSRPGKYTIEERIIVHLQKARAELDAAHAISGDAHWKARGDKTAEQNRQARAKHNMAHRAMEHCSALLWHTEFRGKLTPDQQAAAERLFAETKTTRGY
jgi:hypothetical protein